MEAVNYEHEFLDKLLTSGNFQEQTKLISRVPEDWISFPAFRTAYQASINLIQSGTIANIFSVMDFIQRKQHTKEMFFAIAHGLQICGDNNLTTDQIIEELEAENLKRFYES